MNDNTFDEFTRDILCRISSRYGDDTSHVNILRTRAYAHGVIDLLAIVVASLRTSNDIASFETTFENNLNNFINEQSSKTNKQ